ncbi:mannosyltransferase putative-domain-containing protein [Dichotomocladium elegans]|nr:mannosyltransferase putative-domain-containing protein [Dichotomocladium elegans]
MSGLSRTRLLRLVSLLLIGGCLLLVFSLQVSPALRPEPSTVSADHHPPPQQHDDAVIEEDTSAQLHVENRQTVNEPVVKPDDEGLSFLSVTHDIAIPAAMPTWSEADVLALRTMAGQAHVADLFTVPETIPDFKVITYQQRVYKTLFQYLDPLIGQGIDVANDPKYKDSWDIYQKLENVLYPWLRPYYDNAFHLTNVTSGRGIVMCVGNGHFQYAATAIRTIRQVLRSDLPIEVFYIREGDLSPARRQYLESEFTNLQTVAVVDRINDFYTRFSGWSLKSYAILASSFTEVILMDADVYFFQKPDVLFDDAGYHRTGTLFFYDRTLFPGWETGRRWLSSFLPTMSSFVGRTRWWHLKSAHEQESGVVVIDKRKSLLGLLSTCKMNDRREREEVTYKHIHGDKETFWVGYEMVQTPYAFIKSYGAVIGGLGDAGDPKNVCGNQLHLDVDGKPFWWNGGLLRDKNKWHDRYLTFTHYAEGEDWHFETSCIKETDRIHEFTESERALALKYVELDKERRKIEDMIVKGEWTASSRKSSPPLIENDDVS